MHKGLYWSQLVAGIGIGLILASSIWITVEDISVADALGIPRVGLVQPGGNYTVPSSNPVIPADGTVQPGAVTNGSADPANPNLPAQNPTRMDSQGLTQPLQQGVSLSVNTGNAALASNPAGAPQVSPPSQLTAQVSLNTETTDRAVQPSDRIHSTAAPVVHTFVVNPGDSSERIANRLEKYGIVSSSDFLRAVHVRNLDRKLKAGHYELTAGESLNEIIAKLIR